MQLMLRCPAISADGTVAMFSLPTAEKASTAALVFYDDKGAVKRRITDLAKANAALDGFARMDRVKKISETASARVKPTDPAPSYEAELSTGDVRIHVHIAGRDVTLQAARNGAAMPAVRTRLAPNDGPCTESVRYDLVNTQSGFDARRGVFAFTIGTEDATKSQCFHHDFVVRFADATPEPPQTEPAKAPAPNGPHKLTFNMVYRNSPHGAITSDVPVIKLGTHEGSTIRIDWDPAVARIHAVIENGPSGVTVFTLGPDIFVNGKKVNKAVLKTGDVLQLGDTKLAITVDD